MTRRLLALFGLSGLRVAAQTRVQPSQFGNSQPLANPNITVFQINGEPVQAVLDANTIQLDMSTKPPVIRALVTAQAQVVREDIEIFKPPKTATGITSVTISRDPINVKALSVPEVIAGGLILEEGFEYRIAGRVITMDRSYAGEVIKVKYRY
jgi:hypothetical protein